MDPDELTPAQAVMVTLMAIGFILWAACLFLGLVL
jgi:hypothetical protein